MKRENFLAPITRCAFLSSLIFFACFASAQAQRVIPRVCINLTNQPGAEVEVHLGYQNLLNETLFIPKTIQNKNFFVPSPFFYEGQPDTFLPGIHENVFAFNLPLDEAVTWILDGAYLPIDQNTPRCVNRRMTYQGRLTDGAAAANGNYDLRFTVFDSLSGGAAQRPGGSVTIENVPVTNGVFTVQLNFGAALTNNVGSKFLEIAVRPGAATGDDSFTVLTPRQPVTSVPFAVMSQSAITAVNVANVTLQHRLLRLRTANDDSDGMIYSGAISGTEFRGFDGFRWMTGTNGATERMRLDSSGNLMVIGNLTVNGTINGTVANADKLGNVGANQYVLTTDPRLSANNNTNFIQNTTTQQTGNFNISGNGAVGGNLTVSGTINGSGANLTNFGQNVTTASGSGSLTVETSLGSYTLVPGLTQTVNVPANAALLITTDGGIQSVGTATSSYSVVDVAIFVDGAAIGERRIVVTNNPLPQSVGNWALSGGQTLAAGSHTIEIRVRSGLAGSSNAKVSDSAGLLRGQLTIAVVKK